jgi:membrane protease YdiL (CAAX protease family)
MKPPLHFRLCSNCGKQTPLNNFCAFCGINLPSTETCRYCQAKIPIQAIYCPSCGNITNLTLNSSVLAISPQPNRYLIRFRTAILIIFLLSTYTLIQFLVGSFLFFLYPSELVEGTTEFVFWSLLSLVLSTILMILVIWKLVPSSFHTNLPNELSGSIFFSLIIILIISVSLLEIALSFADFLLDIIQMDSTQLTPYDIYFSDPFNIIIFLVLAVIAGPIFEELVFRRFIISLLSSQSQSNIFVISVSALIFGLSHTLSDLLEGSLRYAILHFVVTFSLGIVLAIILLRWGLKIAILFHSIWNMYSFVSYILNLIGFIELLDLMILVFLGITFVLLCITIVRLRKFNSINKEIVNFPTVNEFLIVGTNIFLVIMYELFIPLILLSFAQNIITTGFVLFMQIIGFILGIIFIDKERKLYGAIKLDS